jgi:HlyD family secretion protein
MALKLKLKFRTVFWIAAAVVLAVMLVVAFRPQPLPVDMSEVSAGPMIVAVRDEAHTRVHNEYVVSAPVAGQLLRVPFKAGAKVMAGDTVARILPADPTFLDVRTRAESQAAVRSAEASLRLADAELEAAEAQHTYARTEAERLGTLRDRGLVAQDALDRARLQLRVAESDLGTAREGVRMRQAEVEVARARLLQPGAEGTESAVVEVTAPVSGNVLRVAQESAAVILSGAEILSIGDPADLEIVAELLSTDAVSVTPGARVIVENWGRDRAPLHGTVRLVEPFGFLKVSALGVEEQRVNVIVDFTGAREAWTSLGHGYRVEVAIVVWETANAVQVPVSALFRYGGEWAVYVVDDGGVARRTPVEVGRDNGQSAEILSGLEPGTTVILYPGEQLDDGARVVARGN